MIEFKILSVEELALDSFLKKERLDALAMMNTPLEYEDRKKAFIDLQLARSEYAKAKASLESAISA